MNKVFILIITSIVISGSAFTHAANTNPLVTKLSGKVTDKITREALEGVSIYIPDLKTGTLSKSDGTYELKNLPESKVLIYLSYLGYKLIIKQVDLDSVSVMNFQMEESIAELNEIVVTGLSEGSEKNRAPTPIVTIPRLQLLQVASNNIIDAISKKPGISQITTGSGISKPVIRGLGYNRVLVVNDGIRQEGQQWGDEHGIEIDEYSVNKVEILKGPASLSYGSDALAGVINMVSSPTLPEGIMKGNFIMNYQTNNGLIGFSGNMAGNSKGFIWDLRYSKKASHAYKNKYDQYVFNSGFHENSISGIIGLNKSWGYSHLHVSSYLITPGIVEGDRDSSTRLFIKPVKLPDNLEGTAIANDEDYLSYNSFIPYQKVNHYKAVLNNSIVIGNGSLKAILGFQQNRRKEYSNILTPDQSQLYFQLNTFNYDLRYVFPEVNKFSISTGLNGMYQNSLNLGREYLIPEYSLFDIGAFTIVKKTLGKLEIQAGLRYDTRDLHSKELYLDQFGDETTPENPNAVNQFKRFTSGFYGLSGSIGLSYLLTDKVYTKVNVSRGFRAPNISELGSNGIHEGTIRYEIGEPTLKSEGSLQLDYAIGINTQHVSAELDIFSNSISNYVYSSKINSSLGGDSLSNGYKTYKFTSGSAYLWGGEFMIDIHPHPLDWLHFENSFSMVNAVLEGHPDSTKYLPFTPSAKLTSEIRANIKKLNRFLGNSYFSMNIEYYFAQNNFYAANGTETATPAYSLLNIGLGTDILKDDNPLLSVYISVNNLTDKAYQSHLSRLKYTDINRVSNRPGVFSMGRNISIKVILPFQISK